MLDTKKVNRLSDYIPPLREMNTNMNNMTTEGIGERRNKYMSRSPNSPNPPKANIIYQSYRSATRNKVQDTYLSKAPPGTLSPTPGSPTWGREKAENKEIGNSTYLERGAKCSTDAYLESIIQRKAELLGGFPRGEVVPHEKHTLSDLLGEREKVINVSQISMDNVNIPSIPSIPNIPNIPHIPEYGIPMSKDKDKDNEDNEDDEDNEERSSRIHLHTEKGRSEGGGGGYRSYNIYRLTPQELVFHPNTNTNTNTNIYKQEDEQSDTYNRLFETGNTNTVVENGYMNTSYCTLNLTGREAAEAQGPPSPLRDGTRKISPIKSPKGKHILFDAVNNIDIDTDTDRDRDRGELDELEETRHLRKIHNIQHNIPTTNTHHNQYSQQLMDYIVKSNKLEELNKVQNIYIAKLENKLSKNIELDEGKKDVNKLKVGAMEQEIKMKDEAIKYYEDQINKFRVEGNRRNEKQEVESKPNNQQNIKDITKAEEFRNIINKQLYNNITKLIANFTSNLPKTVLTERISKKLEFHNERLKTLEGKVQTIRASLSAKHTNYEYELIEAHKHLQSAFDKERSLIKRGDNKYIYPERTEKSKLDAKKEVREKDINMDTLNRENNLYKINRMKKVRVERELQGLREEVDQIQIGLQVLRGREVHNRVRDITNITPNITTPNITTPIITPLPTHNNIFPPGGIDYRIKVEHEISPTKNNEYNITPNINNLPHPSSLLKENAQLLLKLNNLDRKSQAQKRGYSKKLKKQKYRSSLKLQEKDAQLSYVLDGVSGRMGGGLNSAPENSESSRVIPRTLYNLSARDYYNSNTNNNSNNNYNGLESARPIRHGAISFTPAASYRENVNTHTNNTNNNNTNIRFGEYMGEYRGRESPPKSEALIRRLHELNQLTARVLDDEDVLSSSSENTDL